MTQTLALPVLGRRVAASRLLPDVVSETVLIGAALVVLTWWRGAPTGVGDGAALTDAGRLLGFVAGYVALLQVLLRARLPVVERTLGTDRLNRAHATLGPYLLVVITAHALLLTIGYARAARVDLPSELWTIVTRYPYVAWAAVGAGLLFVIAVLSWRVVRRRMRYEAWHAVHSAAYVAVALAFFHQVVNGEHFRHHPMLRWLWTLVFVLAGAVVIGNRFVRPAIASWRHRLVVASVEPLNGDVVAVRVTGRGLDGMSAQPGQFFRWRFLTPGAWWAANPFSLSAPPTADSFRLTAKAVGRHSAALRALTPVTRVIAEGPCGGLVLHDADSTASLLLIAGGIGITPLRALFEAAEPRRHVTLVYRASTPADVVFRDELDSIAAQRGAVVHYLVGSRTEEGLALTAPRLRALCPDVASADVYICGPAGFVRTVRAALRQLDVPRARVHHESFEM